ncbi:MAG: 3-ketoacyl-CoA thiolase [Candidatus Cloacimonas sp. 4484_143]|nr:MAG: 3-ketoacyl-CoA thiolase [Candidatus Cloacimonas sp. 4484_143]RLC54541.1 MAG: 3-ketoacyl-CoA thiolase [Candidatus Cloacimonadota bacterium]
MKKLRRKIYMTAGYNTISLGTGRKEFNPKKPRPGLEHYLKEAGKATLKMIGGADNVDESVVGNFMAARFNKQGHTAAFVPMIDEKLRYKPSIRVEGACASGSLALATGIKSILAETAEVVLCLGVEVQNTMKAIYGADVLAGAGWYQKRKEGHAYFFPGQFSDRAGAYYEKYGKEYARKGMATWYKNAVENARLCPTAQEYHNKTEDLMAVGLTEPNGNFFVDNLSVYDCSKVSDSASAIAIMSEEGLKRCGIDKKDAVEVIGYAQCEEDLTQDPGDLTELSTIKHAAHQALENAEITIDDLGTLELHDCFSIAGLLTMEALGFAERGKGAQFIADGNTARDGLIPTNTTGGLVGWGHPTGATGVHQAVTIWEQLTSKAGDAQIELKEEKPYGMTINMGGDDKTVVSIVYKRA